MFWITAGAGSLSEPGDGGYDNTISNVAAGKPYMKYSNVRMSDGASWTGNMISTVTATTFTVRCKRLPMLKNDCVFALYSRIILRKISVETAAFWGHTKVLRRPDDHSVLE